MILAMLAMFVTIVFVTLLRRSSMIQTTGRISLLTKKRSLNSDSHNRKIELNKVTVPKSIRDVVSKHDLQQMLSANVHLVDIEVDYTELRRHIKNNQFSNENDGATEEEQGDASDGGNSFPSYNGIYGTFCTLDWALHKKDRKSVV